MASVMLKAQGLKKSFGDLQVLKGIDLEVLAGNVVCLIGASGSGKSTLLRCLHLLEDYEAGEVWLDGVQINHLNSEGGGQKMEKERNLTRSQMGMVFQQFNLWPHLNVLQNVSLAPHLVRKQSTAVAKELAEELLIKVGLQDKLHETPDSLSGGQQQRVAIARALAMQPKVMMFDEATSALDPELVYEVLQTILLLAKEGMTMLLATHQMHFAKSIADHILFLDQGQILEQGTPEEMFSNPQQPRTQQFLQQILQSV